MEKEIKFEVQIQSKDLSDFMIYHTYTKFSGLFGLFLSVGAAILLIMNLSEGATTQNYIYFGVAMLFTVVNPSNLKLKGKAQAVTNPAYKKPLVYLLNEKGITVSQEEVSQLLEWYKVKKIRVTKKYIYVYQNKIHAFIFPKRCFEGQADEILAYLKEQSAKSVPPSKQEPKEIEEAKETAEAPQE